MVLWTLWYKLILLIVRWASCDKDTSLHRGSITNCCSEVLYSNSEFKSLSGHFLDMGLEAPSSTLQSTPNWFASDQLKFLLVIFINVKYLLLFLFVHHSVNCWVSSKCVTLIKSISFLPLLCYAHFLQKMDNCSIQLKLSTTATFGTEESGCFERFKQDSMYRLSAKKSGHYRKVAIVERWPLVEVRLYFTL